MLGMGVLAGNTGASMPHSRATWYAFKVKTTLLAGVLTVWNRVSRRQITSPKSTVDVSLTTYGPRTAGVYLTVESIGLGKMRPRKLILWVDELNILTDPPEQLRRLMKRGLEIRPCDDLGPHKKYFPYTEAFADDRQLLVTADDDVFYPRFWLQKLVKAYLRSPGDVVAYRVKVRSPEPYQQWQLCTTTEPRYEHFATGVSGVLYDQTMVELLRRSDRFLEVCPRADDIWLHYVATSAGIGIRQVSDNPAEFWPLPGTMEHALAHDNTVGGGNDIAIEATAHLFSESN